MEESERAAIRAASNEVSNECKTLIDSEAIESLEQMQHLIEYSENTMRTVMQDSNAVLTHFNEYSENCYTDVVADFSRNTRLLKSMKTDLDYIFLKLRNMKSKIFATYPDAFPSGSLEVVDSRPDLEAPVCEVREDHVVGPAAYDKQPTV